MKKIVAVATLASLLTGATFAADISFSYTGKNYFTSNGNAGVKYDHDKRSDCISLGLKNEYAGAVVDFDRDTDGTQASGITVDSFYGWMDFAAISTEFTAGIWNSRYADNVKTDAGDLDDEDFIGWNYGVTNGSVAKDAGNLTEGKIAMVAAYTNKEALPGELLVKFGFVNSAWDSFTKTDTDGKYTRTNSYGFVGEVAFKQENVFNVNLAIKSLTAHNYSFGLYFSPLMVENLQATAGFALGLDGNTTYKAEGDTGLEYAFDLRARYAITDKFSITTAHNFSSGLTTTGKDGDAKKWNDNKLAMLNQINVTYAFLDNMKFGLNLQHSISDFDAAYPSANTLIVTPSVAIKATEKVNVTVASRGTFENIGFGKGAETFNLTLPLIFSYNY
ncbi:hypothetical protein [Treponema zioleckii]|uniref:hypothetical protein n=1 Tax=Treponema zioleckii TaxID=331680 RepID=UPI00168BFD79|nr:hypothetical protein [Treponema zioleckii]